MHWPEAKQKVDATASVVQSTASAHLTGLVSVNLDTRVALATRRGVRRHKSLLARPERNKSYAPKSAALGMGSALPRKAEPVCVT